MLDVKLLKLDAAVVKRRAEHDRFGGAIAPGKRRQFSPERGGDAVRFAEVAAERKVAGVQQAIDAIGKAEGLRGLVERNIRGAAGDFPRGMG